MPALEKKKQILIVDRDVATTEPLRQKLAEAGFAVRAIGDCASCVAMLKQSPPHLVIIDWNAPGLAAMELIQAVRVLRAPHVVRLIILSALCAEHDVVAGFGVGADDYITKPFSIREAIARVSALLRARTSEASHSSLSCDSLILNVATNRVTANGRLVNLRSVEYRLLEFLMSHQGRTFNRTQLLTQVWGGDRDVDERTVDVNVQRLRRILSEPGFEAYIQTVRGFGYRFGPPTGAEVAAAGPAI
jgi:two-component system, OmpR family, phosphate regulon response regulator PhoB